MKRNFKMILSFALLCSLDVSHLFIANALESDSNYASKISGELNAQLNNKSTVALGCKVTSP